MAITAFYAGILAFIYIWLSVRVIQKRRSERIVLGHGESEELMRRARIHGNFAEYAPFALLLMMLAESLKVPPPLVHLAGLLLVAGRGIHAFALTQASIKLRVAGMLLTFAALATAGLMCFVFGAFHLII